MKKHAIISIVGISIVLIVVIISNLVNGSFSKFYEYFIYDFNSTAEGIIVKSEVNSRGRMYRVLYSYNVNSEEFISDRVNFKANYREAIREVVGSNKKGDKVTVYYDSQQPNISVLDRSAPDSWLFVQLGATLIFGIFIAVLAAARINQSGYFNHQ